MDKKPLKKSKLGPPDVYPQDPKQKEDELNATNVKQGFSNAPQIDNEYGTAKNLTISTSKITSAFNALLAKKQELNTLADTGRKKQQISPKENFTLVTPQPRSKQFVETWFKDLSSGRSLQSLAKKVPIFNKKEEIFTTLCEFQIPMVRAMWFIKMTAAYTGAVSEAKNKKRQVTDPAQEWTPAAIKFLRDQLVKLQDYPGLAQQVLANAQASSIAPAQQNGPTTLSEEQKLALKLWSYCSNLLFSMYREGLLDQNDVLNAVTETFDKCRSNDDYCMRIIVPWVLDYLPEFTNCELLSRKLVHAAIRRFNQLLDDVGRPCPNSEVKQESGKEVSIQKFNVDDLASQFQALGDEVKICPHHRIVTLGISTIIQTVTLDCSTAMVWNNPGEGKPPLYLIGSPLDDLPVAPSELPMAPDVENSKVRAKLRKIEEEIRIRGALAEKKWPLEKGDGTTTGALMARVLPALDALDRYYFDKVDQSNSLDTLYSKIFQSITPKEFSSDNIQEIIELDEPLVKLLCEWAVSDQRYGEHRAVAAALLLEKRQYEISNFENDSGDEKESAVSVNGGPPVFQSLLMKFLDKDAPVLGETPSLQQKLVFGSLVHLFYEFVRNDVFSHDAYMCTLISRGDLLNINRGVSDLGLRSIMKNDLGGSMFPSSGYDFDDSKIIDDDLDKILQDIKGQQMGGDDCSSPKPEPSTTSESKKQPRHLLYTMHFPLPQDDTSNHDSNQRHVLLYGVGKARDEARHQVKKVTKDVAKLFHKKFCVDVTEGGKPRKHSRSEFNFELVVQKFQLLSYFDRHVVTGQVSVSVLEMLSSFAAGNSNYLPVPENVSFLFDLMELGLNIYGLLDFCVSILKELPDVDQLLSMRNSPLTRTFICHLTLYIIGVLRRFHSCLLLFQEQTILVFEVICKIGKPIVNPADCTSAERCILAYLYDLYTPCKFLMAKKNDPRFEPFNHAYPKIKQTICSSVLPSNAVFTVEPEFMREYILNPKKKVDSQVTKQLNDSHQLRYSFVSSVVLAVCQTSDSDRINDLAHLSAELTACCNSLVPDWLTVLEALCNVQPACYVEIMQNMDINDLTIHMNLGIFFAILVARHCFGLQDFLLHVGLPSLMKIWNFGQLCTEAEPGARLACHIILRLFKTPTTPQPACYSLVGASPHPNIAAGNQPGIKLTCDRHLLAAAHNSIRSSTEPVVAVLKAVLLLANYTDSKKDHNEMLNVLGISDINIVDEHEDPNYCFSVGMRGLFNNYGPSRLSAFARYVLRQICSQPWVHERCLQIPEDLLKNGSLMDSLLNPKNAQRLLNMISRMDKTSGISEESLDNKQTVTQLFENLNQWNIRVSLLDLQLIYRQYSQSELSQWLDIIAKSTMDLFYVEPPPKSEDSPSKRRAYSNFSHLMPSKQEQEKNESVWLVAPLVARLSPAIHGRILKFAIQALETTNWVTLAPVKSKDNKDRDRDRERERDREKTAMQVVKGNGPTLRCMQQFCSLIMTCLNTQEEQKEPLLAALLTQLQHYTSLSKEDKLYGWDDLKSRQYFQDCLHLRLSLAGGLFDAIQENITLTTDWAILLVQLVTSHVIDLTNHSSLFTMVVDMLTSLVHSTLVTDSVSEKGEEYKKHYFNLAKKLKKELADRRSPSIAYIRQMLPMPLRCTFDVVACEQVSCLIDSKGNKIQGFDTFDKKQGLKVHEKHRLNPWDILEGHKTPAPLSLSWFGAVKVERRPLRYEEMHRLLKHHTHDQRKSCSHYLEPPPVPPEEENESLMGPNSQREEIKPDTPMSSESPRAKRAKTTAMNTQAVPNKRRPRRGGVNAGAMGGIVQPPVNMGFQGPQSAMYQQQQQQWGYNQQQTHGQQGYYPQQMNQGVGPRFERAPIPSRQALANMIRGRQTQPTAAYGNTAQTNVMPQGPMSGGMQQGTMAGPMRGQTPNQPFQNMAMLDKQRQQQFIRQQQMRGGVAGQGGMYPQQMAQQYQQMPGQSMGNQQFGMYTNQSQQAPAQNFGGMMPQRGMAPRPSYMQGGTMTMAMNQQPGYPRGSAPMNQQQMQRLQQQQQMLAMQQQQQQQQHGMYNQPPGYQ
ncbi:mediator of RNA polymerase II transcription subunit 12-like protein isoform X2 [Artemia franciscana]|uniref:Mediator complex subunit Med12 domain-containing protein n=1 Tax=Artemia franciscana TaxID=6661 RepID=A0AA88LBR1_ARTSF|nr:hypothetical protein QYM36_005156 [Artemia franciscana]